MNSFKIENRIVAFLDIQGFSENSYFAHENNATLQNIGIMLSAMTKLSKKDERGKLFDELKIHYDKETIDTPEKRL